MLKLFRLPFVESCEIRKITHLSMFCVFSVLFRHFYSVFHISGSKPLSMEELQCCPVAWDTSLRIQHKILIQRKSYTTYSLPEALCTNEVCHRTQHTSVHTDPLIPV